MNERIKSLRNSLKLTQQEFADKLKVSRDNIANYEIGRREPTAAVISLICATFSVNEVWLRTGVGEMFIELTRDEQIAAFVAKSLSGKTDDKFKLRVMSLISRLSDAEWSVLEGIADKLAEEYKEEQG